MTQEFSHVAFCLISGAGSAFVTTTWLQPLDVIKTRIQETSVRKNCNSNSHRLLQVMKDVFRTGGFRGYWNGLSASLWRNVPGVALYYGSLDALLGLVRDRFPNQYGVHSNFVLASASAVSRTFAASALFPFTFIKTRYESSQFSYKGVFFSLKSIANRDGFWMLYKGYLPTLYRDVPYSAINFPIYQQIKQLFSIVFGFEFASSDLGRFSAGIISASIATLLTHPADVIKTHMQLKPNICCNIRKTLKLVLQTDGLMGLFRGSLLRIVRRPIGTAANWALFEHIVGGFG